jgi:hypothetical protein
MREGPQQILQLTLQEQTDRLMKEEAKILMIMPTGSNG